ncbi:hypothetical protein QBC34DRAFT_428526 [Podospora aff. communis PSN243]|uniref:Ankyrin repeat protein n=1 Tax=Podospora aff. communis PSN243 TaxID=3040156 RepID=A0AAV9GF63_9PEZI|nr:hypothetical protein QBC34DRAFT_428526 [Podospora aff. communis PSN243]
METHKYQDEGKNPFDPEFLTCSDGEVCQLPVPVIRGSGTLPEEHDRDATQAANWGEPSSEVPRTDPVQEAIRLDDVERLREVLESGIFYRDVSTPGSKLLRANNGTKGIHRLLDLCVKGSAVRCLYHLTLWCQSPHNVFKYDFSWLYNSAKEVALRTGRFACLLALDIAVVEKPEKRRALLKLMLTKANSADAVSQISDLLQGEELDYLPFLLHKASEPHSQPGVIEAFAGRLVRNNDINEADSKSEEIMTPIAAASSMLNLSAMEMLLEMGANPFAAPFNDTERNDHHPLFCVLAQTIPVELPMRSTAWRSAVRPIASRMHTATSLLLARASNTFKNTPAYRRILAKAAGIFVSTLRTFILESISHLDPPTRDTLIVPAWPRPEEEEPLVTIMIEPDHQPAHFIHDIKPAVLRESLAKNNMHLHRDFLDLWLELLTPEMVDAVDRHPPRRPFKSSPITAEDCLLFLIRAEESLVKTILEKSIIPTEAKPEISGGGCVDETEQALADAEAVERRDRARNRIRAWLEAEIPNRPRPRASASFMYNMIRLEILQQAASEASDFAEPEVERPEVVLTAEEEEAINFCLTPEWMKPQTEEKEGGKGKNLEEKQKKRKEDDEA